jgi:hypothetical protein
MKVCARIVPNNFSSEQKMKRKEIFSDRSARLEENMTVWEKIVIGNGICIIWCDLGTKC